MVTYDADEHVLTHYGTPRHSGRYPYGSGKSGSASDFVSTVKELRKGGMTDAEIAKGMGMASTEFRAHLQDATFEQKRQRIETAQKLNAKGWSNSAIGRHLGIPDTSVANLLKPGEAEKANIVRATADVLKKEVAEKKYLDVGHGSEIYMNVSKEKLGNAVTLLQKQEGYVLHNVYIDQIGSKNKTRYKVLTEPGVEYKEVLANKGNIKQVTHVVTNDGGLTYEKVPPPVSVSSKRVKVRYAEEGGADADGVIYVRPGVKDLSLGKANYAQVRVAVDGTHYLKGMAIYKDDLPPGTDLVFNTNKKDTGNKLDAMKPMKADADLPFGSLTRPPSTNDGKKDKQSALNIVNEEGDWTKWSKTLSSQMLSKQPVPLAKAQLDETYRRKRQELDDIKGLTNPEVKKRLLQAYSDGADSASVHLKAAALPRQASYVILPVNSLKPTEIYAPKFRDGERVALVRFPHGGTFEIPEVTVNNRHPEAKKLLGNARDAIGIHSSVAERLSGADFDGDTVLVIPNKDGRVKSAPALPGLIGFDPKKYKLPDDAPRMSPHKKQTEMGKISNLITDMTIRGANNDELARAVRHSMVVIDAEKHHLDYRRSEKENGIPALVKRYQVTPTSKNGGAATLISRSGTSSTIHVNEFKERSAAEGGHIDKATGEKKYVETGASYVDKKTGKTEMRKTEVTRLGYVKDAHKLSSGEPIEVVYADHSNRLKALGNEARKVMVNTPPKPYSRAASLAYAPQVESLKASLRNALRNSPRERQALVLANAEVAKKLEANPALEKSEIKKLKTQAMEKARKRVGAEKAPIEISDKEWEAIQAGAITPTNLRQILDHTNLERVKELATPRTAKVMSQGKKDWALRLAKAGHTPAEIADAIGIPVSVLESNMGGSLNV